MLEEVEDLGLTIIARELGLYLNESTRDGIVRIQIMKEKSMLAEFEKVTSVEIFLVGYSYGQDSNHHENT